MVKKELSRRTFVAGTAVAGAAGVVGRASAQGSTTSPQASPVSGQGIPPEFSTSTNWPTQNSNLQSTRVMTETTVSTETVGQLGLAWSAPIEAEAGFGPLVAPAIIVGDRVYQQDSMSNVHVYDKATGEAVYKKEYNEAVTSGGPNGVAVAHDKVFCNVGVGTVHAIDVATGEDI